MSTYMRITCELDLPLLQSLFRKRIKNHKKIIYQSEEQQQKQEQVGIGKVVFG